MTIVMLNVSNEDCEILMEEMDFEILRCGIFRTSENERGKYLGLFREDATLNLPPRSITTLALDIKIID